MGPRTLLGAFLSIGILLAVGVRQADAATILTSEHGDSIAAAIAAASDNDTIRVDTNTPLSEAFNVAGVAGLTIEAAGGFDPVLKADENTDLSVLGFGLGGILVNVDSGCTIRGITFEIDLTNLNGVLQTPEEGDPQTFGYGLLRVASGATGPTVIENCNFELSGTAGSDPIILSRDRVRVEGASDVTITGCEFRYRDMDLTPFPAFNNTLVYFIPGEGDTLNLNVSNCDFDMAADMVPDGGKARSFANGNADAGNAVVVVDNCRFGLNRRDHAQRQQAWIYPGGNTDLTIRNCDFPNGAARYYGGGVGMNARLEACTIRNTWGADVLLPDPSPGANTRVTCVNCAFSFVSNNAGPGKHIARSADDGSSDDGRGFTFLNCTFDDLSGSRGEGFVQYNSQPSHSIVRANDNSPAIEFENCIFNVPGWTRHIVRNESTPGNNTAGGVTGSGNLIHSRVFPLVEGILPMGAFAVSGQDPLLADDGIHLLDGSPAINAAVGGEASDIDGDGLTGSRDIGADERGGADDTDPRRTITMPGDAADMRQALAMANGNRDIIEVTGDGPYFGKIRTAYANGGSVSSKLHIRAADGTNPIFVLDFPFPSRDPLDFGGTPEERGAGEFASEEVLPAEAPLNSCGCYNVAFDFNQSVTLSGIHLRMDVTETLILDIANIEQSSRILFKTQGREMEAIFNDCIFEIVGNPQESHDAAFGGRQMGRHEGNTRNVFNNCHWRWDMKRYFFPAFTNASGYFNPTPGDGADITLIEMIYNGCIFDAGPDQRGNEKMRFIGAGGGGQGEVNLEVNGCLFGNNRERYNMNLMDPENPEAFINLQGQQAGISPATGGTTTVVTDSVFLDGMERHFGSDPATTETGIFVNRCIMEPTFGFNFEPDPGSVNSFFVTNTVMRWDSRNKGDDDPSNDAIEGEFDVAVRGEASGGDRGIVWTHCLLQDVAGEEGRGNVSIMNFDDFSGINGGITQLVNCIVDAPGMTQAMFMNNDAIARDPENPANENPIELGNPTGSGNLLNTAPLQQQIFPEAGILNRGDPRFGSSDGGPAGVAAGGHDAEDPLAYHLTECSLLAIDQVDRASNEDIDGDSRPSGAGQADIGPDEFQGTPAEPGDCLIEATGACCTEGVCDVQTQADCEAGGGRYDGDDVPCGTVDCLAGVQFRRGDHDGSGVADITDALNLLGFLFLGTTPPICNNASDFDNSGALDITDALILLGHLFLGQPNAIPAPGTVCGLNPDTVQPAIPPIPEQQPSDLGCDEYPGAAFPGGACP